MQTKQLYPIKQVSESASPLLAPLEKEREPSRKNLQPDNRNEAWIPRKVDSQTVLLSSTSDFVFDDEGVIFVVDRFGEILGKEGLVLLTRPAQGVD